MIAAPENTRLADFLAEQEIRLKSYRENSPIRARCPKCDGGKEHEDSLVVTIDPGSKGAVWHCHRATCGWTESVLIADPKRKVVHFAWPRAPIKPPLEIPERQQQRTDPLYEFFRARGISRGTVDKFGCFLTTHYFDRKGDKPAGIYPAIAFPYCFNGEVVNRKYRSRDKQIAQEKDPLHSLFNIDAVTDADHVVWVEGELDCMAIHEAGWPQVVSLKDGAPDKLRAEHDPKRKTDRRFQALATHADRLAKIKKFFLAGDSDRPGLMLREELARRLGRNRCWIVNWPSDCKDANDVLLKHGPEAVSDAIFAAKPYPIEDVQEITGEILDAYLERHTPRTLTTGVIALDQVLKIPSEGRLIIITGMPNSGKSQFLMALMMHLLWKEDRRFLVFSPEMQPWEEFSIQCAQVLLGKPARRYAGWQDGDALMTREERRTAGDWMNERLRFLASDAEDHAPTLEWILDRGMQSALRLGITDLVIDPWNEIEHQRGNMTETDYTGRALQMAKAFAYRHGCNVWIAVHPTKMRPAKPGDEIGAPGPYDINGSANFANKADVGITVHTPRDITQVIMWKARFRRWGRKGEMAELLFDQSSGRYRSQDCHVGQFGRDAWDTLDEESEGWMG